MEKVIILKETEAREISVFLAMLESEEKRQIVRGNESKVNMDLLKHYKDFLWKV